MYHVSFCLGQQHRYIVSGWHTYIHCQTCCGIQLLTSFKYKAVHALESRPVKELVTRTFLTRLRFAGASHTTVTQQTKHVYRYIRRWAFYPGFNLRPSPLPGLGVASTALLNPRLNSHGAEVHTVSPLFTPDTTLSNPLGNLSSRDFCSHHVHLSILHGLFNLQKGHYTLNCANYILQPLLKYVDRL